MNNIDSIFLCGGSVRTFAILGSLRYLINNNIISIENINTFYGVSAGSLIAFLFTLKYTINEIITIFGSIEFELFIKFDNIKNIIKKQSLNTGMGYKYLLMTFLKKKLDVYDISFEDFYKKTNYDLTIFGYNLTKKNVEMFSHIMTPKMSIVKALCISSSLPYIFKSILYNNNYYCDGCIYNGSPELIKLINKNHDNILFYQLVYKYKPDNENIFNKLFINIVNNMINYKIAGCYTILNKIQLKVVMNRLNLYNEVYYFNANKAREYLLYGENDTIEHLIEFNNG